MRNKIVLTFSVMFHTWNIPIVVYRFCDGWKEKKQWKFDRLILGRWQLTSRLLVIYTTWILTLSHRSHIILNSCSTGCYTPIFLVIFSHFHSLTVICNNCCRFCNNCCSRCYNCCIHVYLWWVLHPVLQEVKLICDRSQRVTVRVAKLKLVYLSWYPLR